jgi:hypothetical protein
MRHLQIFCSHEFSNTEHAYRSRKSESGSSPSSTGKRTTRLPLISPSIPNRALVLPTSESSSIIVDAHHGNEPASYLRTDSLRFVLSCSSPWFDLPPLRRRSGSSCCRTGRGRRVWPSTTSRSRIRRSTRSSTR